jgi:hypothetical protein
VIAGWQAALEAVGARLMITLTNVPYSSIPTSTLEAQTAAVFAHVPNLIAELDNELDATWNGSSWNGTTPQQYLPLFAAFLSGARSSSGSAVVLPSPVANINDGGGGWHWIGQLAAAGVFELDIDALSFHTYQWPKYLAPTVDWAGGNCVTLIAPWIAYVASLGWDGPNWAGEWGWESVLNGVTNPALQSQYVTAFLTASKGLVPVRIGYMLSDGLSGGEAGDQYFGWCDSSLNPKPVFAAVADIYNAETTTTVTPPPPSPPPIVWVEIDVAQATAAYHAGLTIAGIKSQLDAHGITHAGPVPGT